MSTSHFIAGRWVEGDGAEQRWRSPASGEIVWSGRAGTGAEVDAAVRAARGALGEWAGHTVGERAGAMTAFALQLQARREDLIRAICLDTGKPRWESITEVESMVKKVGLAIDAHQQRRAEQKRSAASIGEAAVVRFKPHGVVAVLGPFNLPGHLPNGHIVPALLAGNTVVFKPSEQAPLTGQLAAEVWEATGLPAGVFNLVQGGRETGGAIAGHGGIDGIFFTGSAGAGRAISAASAGRPGKILALEMGGNNPLVVWPPVDVEAAAMTVILSTFITAGQRCTCARRLILPAGQMGDALLMKLAEGVGKLRVGPPEMEPEPFMGPLISERAAGDVMRAYESLVAQGARVIVPLRRTETGAAFLLPGVIDVTEVKDRADEECFGPLLQVVRVGDFEAAIEEANRTAFGLAAGLLCDERKYYGRFFAAVRAGVVNWNHQTTGASSRLPFGGVGESGNGRPAGFWSADYCSYPVASLEAERVTAPKKLPPGMGT